MQEDPNYREVAIIEMETKSDNVNGFKSVPIIPKPQSFIRKIINTIVLAFKKICGMIVGKKEVQKVYKPEPVGLKYVHIEDLTEKKLEDLGGKSIKEVDVLFGSTEEDPNRIMISTFTSHKDALASIFSDSAPKQSAPAIYPVRNRITGRVVMVRGTAESLRQQYNEDYEIVEPYIKG